MALTVAGVIKSFTKNIAQLERIAAAKSREIDNNNEQINTLQKLNLDATSEMDHAQRIKAKLEELVS